MALGVGGDLLIAVVATLALDRRLGRTQGAPPPVGRRRFGLEQAHHLLIASFIAFAVFFALLKLDAARAGGGPGEGLLAAAALVSAVGFALYLYRPRPGAG